MTQLRDVDSAFNQLLKPALASIKVSAEGVEVWSSGEVHSSFTRLPAYLSSMKTTTM